MLVDAVNQAAVESEEEGGFGGQSRSHRTFIYPARDADLGV